MKILVSKKALTEGLALVERIVPKRHNNPLMTAFKMDATQEGLIISGTNQELDLRYVVPAEVHDPECMFIPVHLFGQIVRNLGGELIELERRDDLSENELLIRSAGSEFKLLRLNEDLEGYPPLEFPEKAELQLDAAEFSKALDSVRYAASKETFQAVFRGIKLEHHDEQARVVASDGYRVAIRDFPAMGTGKDLIIPARNAEELIRILKDSEKAQLTYGEGLLSVATDRAHMNLRLLEGDFPNYERVIPQEIKCSIVLNAPLLKEAISRVAVLTDETHYNRVDFMISENTLRLSVEGDHGHAHDTLDVKQSGEEPAMSLSFNAQYVLDALSPLSDDVEMLLSGPASPAILREASSSRYTAVVVALKN